MTNEFYGPTTVEEAAAALLAAAEALKTITGETTVTLEVSNGVFIVVDNVVNKTALKAPLPAGGGGRDNNYEV